MWLNEMQTKGKTEKRKDLPGCLCLCMGVCVCGDMCVYLRSQLMGEISLGVGAICMLEEPLG